MKQCGLLLQHTVCFVTGEQTMSKRVLYINDHLTECNSNDVSNFAGVITHSGMQIDDNKSYTVSPVEVDYDFLVSLSKKFDEVIFLTDHKNYTVRILQECLKSELDKNTDNKIFPNTKGIKFFGCSHTYGTALENREYNAYPYVLSKMLNNDSVYNLATPGGSNYCILESISSESLKNGVAIVQFTDIYRIIDYRVGKSTKVYNTSVRFSEEVLLRNFKTIVNEIVNRLRDSNCKFLLTFTVHYDNKCDLECIKHLLQFEEFVPSSGVTVDLATDGSHYGVRSHKKWAERLYNKWKTLYDRQTKH